jgi:protein-S-isoprenylcysteine O-methyltransferase Ste14
MIALEISAIVFLFFLFAVSHTFLASRKIKIRLAQNIGSKIAFYRLFYNLSSLLFFFVFYELSPKPDVIVYDLHYPYDIITFALQVLSLFGLLWVANPISIKDFIGISQIEKYFKGNYDSGELDEKLTLKIEGAFKFVRHPIYLFSILFLAFRPSMDLFYLTTLICVIIYFYIGSIYEEKKLVEVFGNDYLKYQQNVPRLIPWKKKRSNKEQK